MLEVFRLILCPLWVGFKEQDSTSSVSMGMAVTATPCSCCVVPALDMSLSCSVSFQSVQAAGCARTGSVSALCPLPTSVPLLPACALGSWRDSGVGAAGTARAQN